MIDTEGNTKLLPDEHKVNLPEFGEEEGEICRKIEDNNNNNKNNLLKLCLILLLFLLALVLLYFTPDSWMEQSTTSSYTIVHIAAVKGKQPGCSIDYLTTKYFCQFTSLQPDLNLPGCTKVFDSDGFNRKRFLDVVGEMNQNIQSDSAEISFGTKATATVENQISALSWHSFDLQLVQISVCLENATGYITLLNGITTKRNATILPNLGQRLINGITNLFKISQETEQSEFHSLPKANSNVKADNDKELVWIPCQETQSEVNCVLSETMNKEPNYRNKTESSRNITIDGNISTIFIRNVLSKISQKSNKCDSVGEDLKICENDIMPEFMELFEIPLVKRSFQKYPFSQKV